MTLKENSPATLTLENSHEPDRESDRGTTAVSAERQRPPIGELLRNLRGDRTIREVEKESKIPNSYLSNVESGAKRPGLKTLSKLADYYGVPLSELLQVAGLPSGNNGETGATSALDIHRSFDFILADPALSPYRKPQDRLSTDTQRFIVELYEHYTGKRLL